MDPDNNFYKFGSFFLNAGERVLLRDGRVVPLPAKALSTLLILVRNKGHVVEKDALMNEIWPDEFVEEGNLAQHIFTLRKALGETKESPTYIQTVPRRGYRFVANLKQLDDEDPHRGIDSLAILPFFNASNDPNMEYLSDGITQSIMTSLSHLPQLKVMARSTVFRYKGKAVDPQEVGQRLGVRAVMTGSVQQLGEHLTINTELVDVEDGSRIWGDHFHRKSSDIFSVQEELACEISENLRLKLSGEQQDRLTKRFTQNREAYEFYLRGRYSWSKRTDSDLRRAIEHFQRAIALDPNYSLAYAGLADCFLLLGTGTEQTLVVMPKAKAAAMKAIELDETLGEAYASLAQIKFYFDWDWNAAETYYQRAIKLSPTWPTAHQWYGEYLVALGRTDEGLSELNKARDLDPLSLIVNTDLGLNLSWVRQNDLAIKQFECAIELEPGFFRAHLYLGVAYAQKLMYRKAIAELEKARSIDENPYTLAGLGYVYATFGDHEQAEDALNRLLRLSQVRYVSPATIAVIHAGFPDRTDQTLEYLERAYTQRAVILVWLNLCPVFDNIRSDTRFVRLLQRIGFPSSLAADERSAQISDGPVVAQVGAPGPSTAVPPANAVSRPAVKQRTVGDLSETQDEPAKKTSATIRQWIPEDERLLTKDYTRNAEAFEAYLQGRYHWGRHTKEGLAGAIEYFQQAIDLDPGFALPYAGVVDCYLRLTTNYLPLSHAPLKGADKIENLKIEEQVAAEAQRSLKLRYLWDLKVAERARERALDLKTNDLSQHQWHAVCLFSANLYDTARTTMKLEQEQDSVANVSRSLMVEAEALRQIRLSQDEEVQLFCTVAREQIEAGNYDASCAVLHRWWTIGEWPRLEGLSPYSAADLLLTAGVLAGCITGIRCLPMGHKHAEALLNGAFALFENLGLKKQATEVRIELGSCYYQQSLLELARRTFQVSLAELANKDLELKTVGLTRLAIVERVSGRLNDALARLNEAANIVTLVGPRVTGPYHHTLATILQSRGRAESSDGYVEQTLKYYDEALYEFQALGNHSNAAAVENDHGYLLLILERFDEAESHLLSARKLYDAIGDNIGLAIAEYTLANLHLATKRIELAEQEVLRSVKILETSGHEAKLVESLMTFGLVLIRLGRYREAKRVLTRAHQGAERRGDSERAGLALVMVIEEMRDHLDEDESLELAAELGRLLANTPDAATAERLQRSLELISPVNTVH